MLDLINGGKKSGAQCTPRYLRSLLALVDGQGEETNFELSVRRPLSLRVRGPFPLLAKWREAAEDRADDIHEEDSIQRAAQQIN